MTDFQLGPGASEPLRNFVAAIEPYGIKGSENTALRKIGFSKADTNGSGMASLAEIENFISSALAAKFEGAEEEAEALFKLFRPCYIAAFNNAKKLGKNSGKVLSGMKTATADDYISFSEFRLFCVYLCMYATMYEVFTTVDGGDAGRTEDDDSRISLDEFLGGYHSLGTLGFQALKGIDSDAAASALFHVIDSNDGGFVLFKEWSKYISGKEIKLKTHLGTLFSGNLKPQKITSTATTPKKAASRASTPRTAPKSAPRSASRSAPRKNGGSDNSTVASSASRARTPASPSKKLQMIMPVKVAGVYKPGKAATQALKDFIKSVQPYAEKTAQSLKLRKYGFKQCDTNGTGECSLAEVDGFVLTNLKKDYGPEAGETLFDAFRPSYIVAYNEAKDLKKNATGNDGDYINFPEFRILCVYLCIYAGMLDAFSTIDGGGAGVDANDDRRISKTEWLEQYMNISQTGFVGLDRLSNEDKALATYEQMDADGSGIALFKDFCGSLSNTEIKADTALGKLLLGSSLVLAPSQSEEAPAEDEPGEDEPGEDEPVEDEPAEDVPAEDEPAEDVPAEDEPAEDEPAEDEPAEDEPVEDEPAEDEPAEDEPAGDEPAEDEPAEDEPAEDEPAEDEPAEDEPAEDEPAEDEPAEDEPAGDEPAGDELADELDELAEVLADDK